MIVHFYWCYFSYFLHPFSFTNSFCTNSSTKKISCTKPKPIVNRPSSGAGSPLQTSTNIINCTKHNPPPHHRKPNNKLCSWSPTCACVRAYFDWLSLFFFHHHNYYRAYRTTVQPPWSTHTTKTNPKKIAVPAFRTRHWPVETQPVGQVETVEPYRRPGTGNVEKTLFFI